MSCLSNIHPWSINVKFLLSWQFPQAPQTDGHLLYAVLRCWFVRCHLLNIPSPVLAVCSVTEKGRREGYACPTPSLCQNAHYRHLPRNLRPLLTRLEPNHPPLILRHVCTEPITTIQWKTIIKAYLCIYHSLCAILLVVLCYLFESTDWTKISRNILFQENFHLSFKYWA